eukprot:TRINITY_DN8056_c0_g1_i2.p1 TRINITY_DN8056_c0_g1~~TRINITY_DN8056_c0_g1_i2.p1  ORF type:complete len:293 (+),score=60.36 TRINITY_DN8056_c0_g1_i2:52-930(+)
MDELILLHLHAPHGEVWDFLTSPSSTVQALREQISNSRALSGQTLRIIFQGRVLEASRSIDSYRITSGDHLHLSITPHAAPPPSFDHARTALNDPTHPLHFLQNPNSRFHAADNANFVNRLFGNEANAEINQHATNSAAINHPAIRSAAPLLTSRPRGFDRLRVLGHSEADINQIRIQFQAHQFRGNLVPESEQQLRDMEDEWIENYLAAAQEDLESAREPEQIVHLQEEYHQMVEGTYNDMFLGMCIGFVFGILIIPFVNEPFVNRRQRIGIIAGLGCNVSFGLLRLVLKH